MILPHRPPFLMVDSIISHKSGKNPSLFANYTIKNNQSLNFTTETDDHWPSMYVVEGLGQCCNLLIVIYALEKELMKADHRINSIDEVFKRLMDDENDMATRVLKDILHLRQLETFSRIGFMGAADIEITGHAKQGQVISYEVQLTQAFGSLFYSVVKAYTNNNLIANGTLVSARRKG